MKRVAAAQEAVVVVPSVVAVVEVEITLVVVPVEDRHDHVTIRIAGLGAEYTKYRP